MGSVNEQKAIGRPSYVAKTRQLVFFVCVKTAFIVWPCSSIIANTITVIFLLLALLSIAEAIDTFVVSMLLSPFVLLTKNKRPVRVHCHSLLPSFVGSSFRLPRFLFLSHLASLELLFLVHSAFSVLLYAL